MSKTIRTTLYLSEDYKKQLEHMSDMIGSNQSEVIRASLDYYYDSDPYNNQAELHQKRKELKNQNNMTK